MKLLTKKIEDQLRKNWRETRDCNGADEPDHKPVLKIFGGPATWLFTELSPDGDTLFGLCDLGQGFPELGYVTLTELRAVRLKPFGLPLERDMYFTANKTLSQYADVASEYRAIRA